MPNPGTTATLTYNGGTLNSGLPGGPTATVVATATGVGTVSTAFTPTPAVWYVANGSSRVGFVSYNGSLAGETSIPTASSGPFDIATTPDNNLYYTEQNVDKIGRIHLRSRAIRLRLPRPQQAAPASQRFRLRRAPARSRRSRSRPSPPDSARSRSPIRAADRWPCRSS